MEDVQQRLHTFCEGIRRKNLYSKSAQGTYLKVIKGEFVRAGEVVRATVVTGCANTCLQWEVGHRIVLSTALLHVVSFVCIVFALLDDVNCPAAPSDAC